jgi:hypothetical protein
LIVYSHANEPSVLTQKELAFTKSTLRQFYSMTKGSIAAVQRRAPENMTAPTIEDELNAVSKWPNGTAQRSTLR